MKNQSIRNFAIIAHVDHGKSTLADRFLELTGVVESGKHDAQLLDSNPISRQRGITIKLAPVRMTYKGVDLNLIDTPGHVDFSYEVERTLACVEGAILLVDATQGIQAQTIAHAYKALEQNLVIIPAVNKIDAPHAEVEKTVVALATFLGVQPDTVLRISAKTGVGVTELLDEVVSLVPDPNDGALPDGETTALIFDSYYDPYRGVVAFVRVFSGTLTKGQTLMMPGSDTSFVADEVGIFVPDLQKEEHLSSGQIGYVMTKLKDIRSVQVGDSLLSSKHGSALPGYKKVKPMVYTTLFPTDPDDFTLLVDALQKVSLNDAALTSEQIYSQALGAGIRVGFLGLLHADVIRQRLEQEYNLSIIATPPTVQYQETPSAGRTKYEEPVLHVTIVAPIGYVGDIMSLASDARSVYLHMDTAGDTVSIKYKMPLAELISGFFDRLKTQTSGHGSLDWEFYGYELVDVDKMELLLNLTPVEELSHYVVAEKAYYVGREITEKLKELIPRQQYEVKIQARYKGKIIASTRVAPLRKDVTAKLYGGDRTRKDKLLKKQKEGKKKMKMIGSVTLPKDVFQKLFSQD